MGATVTSFAGIITLLASDMSENLTFEEKVQFTTLKHPNSQIIIWLESMLHPTFGNHI